MRRLLLLGVLFLGACAGPREGEGFAPQYRAWCRSESKPLGAWTFDRAEAERQVAEHLRLRPHDQAWLKIHRGDPSATGLR